MKEANVVVVALVVSFSCVAAAFRVSATTKKQKNKFFAVLLPLQMNALALPMPFVQSTAND